MAARRDVIMARRPPPDRRMPIPAPDQRRYSGPQRAVHTSSDGRSGSDDADRTPPRIEEHPHPGVAVDRQDAAQRYGRVRVARDAQGLTALDDL